MPNLLKKHSSTENYHQWFQKLQTQKENKLNLILNKKHLE
jgi:hypothetical protein